jgi:hypothetical protein
MVPGRPLANSVAHWKSPASPPRAGGGTSPPWTPPSPAATWRAASCSSRRARSGGGARASDTIITVLLGDPTVGELVDVGQRPRAVVDRLRHDVLTHETLPFGTPPRITVDPVYDAREARAVITAARADYDRRFDAGARRDDRPGGAP